MLPEGYENDPTLLLAPQAIKAGLSLEDQTILANHENIEVVQVLAAYPHLHPQIVDYLLDDEDDQVRKNLAQARRSFTPEQQKKLLEDVNGEVCEGFLIFQKLAPTIQQMALASDDEAIVTALAVNRDLDVHIQKKLLECDRQWPRWEMIRNSGLAASFHEQFVCSNDVPDRVRIAGNAGLSAEMQARLSFDADRTVCFELARTVDLKITLEMSARFLLDFRQGDFKELAGDNHEALRALAPTWNGSMKSLLEADELTRR